MICLPRQLASFHYLIHYATLAAYFAWLWPSYLRPSALLDPIRGKILLEMGYTLFRHELEIVGVVVMSFALKLKRCRNFDEVVHKFLVHGKILTLILTYVGGDYVVFTVLLAAYAVMMAFLPPPKYVGKSMVKPLNPNTFSAQVRNPKSAEETSNIVFFQTPWSYDCHFFEPVLADLSMKHATDRRKFWSINLELYPEMGSEFGIETSTMSKQLPTLIMFCDGQEIRRLPPLDEKRKVIKTLLDKKGVAKYFELDRDPDEVSYQARVKKS